MHVMKRWLALDLDGTLLEPGTLILPEVVETLDRFVAEGGKIVIASGRTYGNILEVLAKNGIDRTRAFPHAIVANERELYRRQGDEYAPEAQRNQRLAAAEMRLLDVARRIVDQAAPRLAELGIKMWVAETHMEEKRGFVERRFAGPEEAAVAEPIIQEYIPDGIPLRTVPNNQIISLRHIDATKGRALMDLCRLEGVAADELYAVGDAHNDLDMLDGTWGFAAGTVANAASAIRLIVTERGGQVATAPRGHGVVELIEGLLVG